MNNWGERERALSAFIFNRLEPIAFNHSNVLFSAFYRSKRSKTTDYSRVVDINRTKRQGDVFGPFVFCWVDNDNNYSCQSTV